MKKILLTATMLVGFAAVSQAQQGRVGINTTNPAGTLDITADVSAAGNAKPDALLVPRMTRAQLEAKNAAYANGTAATNQNGALVFVSSIADGTGTGKTVNVTATGFYYYDAPAAVWRAMGGGAPAVQRYEGTRGSVTILTNSATYTATASDFFIITKTGGGAMTIELPDPVANVGRLIYVANANTGTGTLTVQNAGGAPTALVGSMAQNRAKAFVSDGTTWVSISFN
ncbi:hypothetical protein [Chryseobacterium sp. MMS23-Vi53]|uniref:hypothetical protein n=1 Tax=Chryseobacterium sp. MMS23-Vi53 TaxID=3386644 RepID=UPI0039EAE0A6